MAQITNLGDTVLLMNSADYKDRFIAEYQQTKIRYEKLKKFCNKIDIAENNYSEHSFDLPKHDCSLTLLRQQQAAMGRYLGILEQRALIEDIDLD